MSCFSSFRSFFNSFRSRATAAELPDARSFASCERSCLISFLSWRISFLSRLMRPDAASAGEDIAAAAKMAATAILALRNICSERLPSARYPKILQLNNNRVLVSETMPVQLTVLIV